MTPQREQYLAKCGKREKELRDWIYGYEFEIKHLKKALTQGESDLSASELYSRIRDRKFYLTMYRHELNRLKGNEEVVPRDVTLDSFVIGYCQEGFGLVGVCSCGKHLVQQKHNYCPWCGRKILWKRVK